MKNKLLIYGTLMKPEIQKEVIGRAIKGVPDSLGGYKKSKIEIDGEIYPVIIPGKNGKIDGMVIEITDEELQKIDEYETEFYKREIVTLASGVSAWTYLKNDNGSVGRVQ